MSQVAFVTTCKGRLHHVQQTLPSLVAQAPAEIILVDYGCPDNTGDWVAQHFPSVKVVRVDDDPGFCLPRARNIGAAHSSAPWICFIDADIRINDGWLDWLQQNLRDGYFYQAALVDGARNPETFGTVVCPRAAFEAVDGYDEVFRGWGGEDDDLYARLVHCAGARASQYPAHFVEAISHADDERTTFHAIKSVEVQCLINACYIKLKNQLRDYGIRDIPFETRQQLLNCISDNLKHHKLQPSTFTIRLQACDLATRDGQRVNLQLEIAKRRRYGLFGARKTTIRILPSRTIHP
ncbi:glycosyltransferase [Pseudomonas sp. WS 5013]|uniref:glycosyltransferase family 2 protein n=1 Tax=Pseudomonas sp. WS 5013 TaxID=2717475 RepID=UPI0014746395|nr:galactosyltransferase-related protein [Pseudomonas sp. WS 5013]NMY42366.1 glycosyltransferase [Pseudomonas sp. WS 5013]